MSWKFFVQMAIAPIHYAAQTFRNQDANDTGKDDIIGITLDYVADVLSAVVTDRPIPPAPAAIR